MYDPSQKNEDDSSDSDWEVEKFEGTPQEYLKMLEKRKPGYVSSEPEEEVWVPDINPAEHSWYAPSLDESKRQSTMISKDGSKIELVIESRISICGDQLMHHGIYNYTINLDFFLGNIFVGVTTYQGKSGGNPMQSEYVHGWDMLGSKWQYGEREVQEWSVNDTPANTCHPYYTFGEKAYAWNHGTKLDFSMDCYENRLTLTWDEQSYTMDLPDVNEYPPCPFLFFYGTELTAIISKREEKKEVKGEEKKEGEEKKG
mmetsp:Transcript_22906/g.38764  ORF Transcript_22906/g.38764 Transcript_22906/m.38764 type:complete len:257 (+) Transcript_22906:71-841(+)